MSLDEIFMSQLKAEASTLLSCTEVCSYLYRDLPSPRPSNVLLFALRNLLYEPNLDQENVQKLNDCIKPLVDSGENVNRAFAEIRFSSSTFIFPQNEITVFLLDLCWSITKSFARIIGKLCSEESCVEFYVKELIGLAPRYGYPPFSPGEIKLFFLDISNEAFPCAKSANTSTGGLSAGMPISTRLESI